MPHIQNPILPGFNPDPSIVRVGDDYYIATSTFEWFPGVAIHHSRDLHHWRLLTHALTRTSQLDMRGNAPSCGVWAPCLSYDKRAFYLIYTDVKARVTNFMMTTHNYLVTAENIEGPWSDPVYLNSSGFDPSLFHDDDGRKWLVNMRCDFRNGKNRFAGIDLQEYSAEEGRLVGNVRTIFTGTKLGATEGPHLYKRNGFYYLMTAEGGTGFEHAVTLARAKKIAGPYEVAPNNPMLTAKGTNATLQKAGHASLVETQIGDHYIVHLASRPLVKNGEPRSMLGRETAIQKVRWNDAGWLELAEGGNTPFDTTPAPALPEHPFPPEPERDNFDCEVLPNHYQALRVPIDESWCSLTKHKGYLTLVGRESPYSYCNQSLIARRVTSFTCVAETEVFFDPATYQEMAGLIAYYNDRNFYYLHVTHNEEKGRVLRIFYNDAEGYHEADACVPVPDGGITLRASIDHADLTFAYSVNKMGMQAIGEKYDASTLSDECAGGWGFTGAFIGISVHDVSGRGKEARFSHFSYRASSA